MNKKLVIAIVLLTGVVVFAGIAYLRWQSVKISIRNASGAPLNRITAKYTGGSKSARNIGNGATVVFYVRPNSDCSLEFEVEDRNGVKTKSMTGPYLSSGSVGSLILDIDQQHKCHVRSDQTRFSPF
jgi:hypothetical protein